MTEPKAQYPMFEGRRIEVGDVATFEFPIRRIAHDGTISAASPAPPAGDGWEPIETAPKDGSRILVFDEMAADNESPVVMVAWLNDAERHNRKRFAWCVPGSWQDEQGGHCTADRPTHWRPLPAPPQGAGEKGGG